MPNTKRHEIKTEYLLEKGIDILWAKGYNGTSVNDIVKAADVPKGSFYFYFDSKEDFAVKALEYYYETHFTPVLELLNNETVPAKQRILNLFKLKTTELKEELGCKMGCMANNLGNEMSDHSEKIRKVILAREYQFKSRLEDLVSEAQESGDINNEVKAEDIVEFILNASKGAMITMKEMGNSYPIDNFISMLNHILKA